MLRGVIQNAVQPFRNEDSHDAKLHLSIKGFRDVSRRCRVTKWPLCSEGD
jgi:hypothetical protein